jgi:S-methylmethionine-dependent homocysteine/selenocysteine methylase
VAAITLLDGPMGTELLARGVPTPLPGWSAHALDGAPDTVEAIHRDYAAAGAVVHTTNTFRTRRRVFPTDWERMARGAVALARNALGAGARVAGSIAPLEDCYRPDLSPADDDPDGTRREHAELAAVLADAGCDLLLVETFPHPGEALLALEAALATGLPTWLSLTPGYRADLLTPRNLAAAAHVGARRGAAAVLVNCVPVVRALEYVAALTESGVSVPVGCYANAGEADDRMGWSPASIEQGAAERYADAAAAWVETGATILGGCCGTGPAHLAALRRSFSPGAANH